MHKSCGVGGGGGWVAWSNLVSAQGPLVLGLGLRVWGQGLTIFMFVSPHGCRADDQAGYTRGK